MGFRVWDLGVRVKGSKLLTGGSIGQYHRDTRNIY